MDLSKSTHFHWLNLVETLVIRSYGDTFPRVSGRVSGASEGAERAKRSAAERVSERTSERTSGTFFTAPFQTDLSHSATCSKLYPFLPPLNSYISLHLTNAESAQWKGTSRFCSPRLQSQKGTMDALRSEPPDIFNLLSEREPSPSHRKLFLFLNYLYSFKKKKIFPRISVSWR